MTQNELNKILENHKHWLNKDVDEWENMYTNLSGAYLSGADLRNADLRNADLRNADLRNAGLRNADLRNADLRNADLRNADLSGADLSVAYLSGANLRGAYLNANLSNADLSYANLSNADLSYANLSGAILINADLIGANLSAINLRNANLRNADLSGTYLRNANLSGAKNIPFIPMDCPDTGAFIGYKKASGYILKLEILQDARRSSSSSRKCRCDKAKVLEIQNLYGGIANVNEVKSNYDKSFIYRLGEIVEEPNFCEDRWNEWGAGIYFFINRQEAVEYYI